jgi:DNA polymerase delta subunit 2
MAVLGMETASGDFEVIDLCYAGLPPLAAPASEAEATRHPLQEKGKGKAKMENDAMDVDEEVKREFLEGGEPVWVALVSGLSAGSVEVPEDLKAQLLAEWLMGEAGGEEVSPCVLYFCDTYKLTFEITRSVRIALKLDGLHGSYSLATL